MNGFDIRLHRLKAVESTVPASALKTMLVASFIVRLVRHGMQLAVCTKQCSIKLLLEMLLFCYHENSTFSQDILIYTGVATGRLLGIRPATTDSPPPQPWVLARARAQSRTCAYHIYLVDGHRALTSCVAATQSRWTRQDIERAEACSASSSVRTCVARSTARGGS